jgi:acyl dehydratase
MRQSLATRWFEDFRIGERFVLPRRTVTAEALRAFAEATGDLQPLRADPRDNDAIGFSCSLARAFLAAVQSVASPGILPFLLEDSLIGLLDQSSRHLRAVTAGDMLSPVLQVTELHPHNGGTGIVSLRSTLHNQAKALVMEGSQRWLLRSQPRG